MNTSDTPPENGQTCQRVPDNQRLPWEREQGWLAGFFLTCYLIVFRPKQAFALRPAGAYYKPWLFLWLVGLPGLLISTYYDPMLFRPAAGQFHPGLWPLFEEALILGGLGIVELVIIGAVCHAFIKRAVEQPAPLWATYRAFTYSSAVNLFTLPLDYISAEAPAQSGWVVAYMVVYVYAVYLQCVGLGAAHGCEPRTALTAIIKTILVLVPITVVVGMFIVPMAAPE